MDTHMGEVPSNKTPALTKSRNMGIRVVGTSNQFFTRGSYSEIKFSKIFQVVTRKTPFSMILYAHHFTYLTIGF